MKANAETFSKDGLEVMETRQGLKVQTDKPHLVSLGGGRLSTAVTLFPLREGRTYVGTENAPLPQDVIIQGTGVDPQHCFLDNTRGVVTLHPLAVMVGVDGLLISRPTRLSQGSMICLGRSNYFRFNHPQEAQFMKSILPNTRISVVPINFAADSVEYHQSVSKSPLTHTNSSPRNSLDSPPSPMSSMLPGLRKSSTGHLHRDDLESEDFVEKVSKFEFLAHSRRSPVTSDPNRWFVRDGIRTPTYPSNPSSTSPPEIKDFNKPNFEATTNANYAIQAKPPPAPKVGPPVAPKPAISPLTSPSSSGSLPISPKFVALTKIDPHISPKVFLPMRSPADSGERNRHRPGRCTPTLQNGSGEHCSLEDLHACQEQLELQHQKVMEERIREQEMAQQEQQRLEDILNTCAEYERQLMKEKSGPTQQECNNKNTRLPKYTSSPPTQQAHNVKKDLISRSPIPSPNQAVHMNRIKTNGSLPRERMNKVSSPGETAPAGFFHRKPMKSTSSEDELNRIFNFEPILSQIAIPNVQNSNQDNQTNCQVDSKSPTAGYSTYPQSPRTRIKTVARRERVEEIYENRLAISEFQLATSDNKKKSLPRPPKVLERAATDGQLLPETEKVATLPRTSKTLDVRHPASPPVSPDDVFVSEKSKTIPRMKDAMEARATGTIVQEVVILRRQKATVARRVSEIRRRAMDLDTREEEAVRELEMERALLEGECQALLESQREDQERLIMLKQRECDLIQGAELAREKEDARINAARLHLEDVERELHRLECSLDTQPEGSPEREKLLWLIKHQHELVDSETKIFEDMEFQQLEHEAHREEEREQVVQKQTQLIETCKLRTSDIKELEIQQEEMRLSIEKETCSLQLERQKLLAEFKKEKNTLSGLEVKLKDLSNAYGAANQNSDTSPKSSDGEIEASSKKKSNSSSKLNGSPSCRSSEDLILSVTSKSPILAKDGSIGRKTTATLMEIERNRQLILEKQGNLVVEEERKRVQELKKRAADEGRLQWEERKQREANCNSFNSMESEVSSATSSDLPADSVSSEDYTDRLADRDLSTSPDDEKVQESHYEVRRKEEIAQQTLEETRPLSGSSQDDVEVKYRGKPRVQQRPLTRYLPVRSEEFDLKQHIESAGHQIELCPHVKLTPTSCRGSLYKLGTKFRTWNKRWFVFDRASRMLLYYSDKSESRPRGGIYFQYIVEVYVDHLHSVKSPNPKLTFCVKTMDRTYYLVAPSAEAMRIWVDVIFTGAEGYQEFQIDS